MVNDLPPPPNAIAPSARSPRQWAAYAETVLGNGVSRDQLAGELARQGCPTELIAATLAAAWEKQHQHANRILGCSGALVVGGLLATILGYAAVSESGGTYFIFYGAVITGIIGLIVGLVRKTKLRE